MKSIVAVLLSLSFFLTSSVAQAITVTRGPYLQLPSSTGMLIAWNTDVACDSVVKVRDSGTFARTYTGAPSTKYHAVYISSLVPNVRYTYSIYPSLSSTTAIASSVTYTAPDKLAFMSSSASEFKFAVVGDTGEGNTPQRDVAARMFAEQPRLIIHTGDVIYPDGQESQYNAKFFSPYRSLLSRAAMMPIPGNHDTMNIGGFLNSLILPKDNGSNSERFYSFKYGPVHFIGLDSTQSYAPGSAQRTWLEAELGRIDPIRWKVVYLHHPPFSVGTHGPDLNVRAQLVPLFEKFKVHVVFLGHNHAYERSTLINTQNSSPTAHKVQYIVTGGGGGGLYNQVRASWSIAYYKAAYHFVGVRVTPNAMYIKGVDSAGVTFDKVTLYK